jgi:beta-lactam-binding protein with PASTA domain
VEVTDQKLVGVVLGTVPPVGTKVDTGSAVTMNVGVKKKK